MEFLSKVIRHPELTRGAAHVAMGAIVAVVATAIESRAKRKLAVVQHVGRK